LYPPNPECRRWTKYLYTTIATTLIATQKKPFGILNDIVKLRCECNRLRLYGLGLMKDLSSLNS
jgi:hypothetical protein